MIVDGVLRRWPTPGSTRSDTICPYTTLCRSPRRCRVRRGLLLGGGFDLRRSHRPGHHLVEHAVGADDVCRLADRHQAPVPGRTEEHTSELQSLMRISYAVFCLKTKTNAKHPKRQNPYHEPTEHKHKLLH